MAPPVNPPSNVRRKIVFMLVAFSVLSYALRMNISIAQHAMAPELGLSDFQLGQIFSAFMLAYALFQIPSGIWGDRRGARLVLTVAAVSWFLATLLTGLVPGILVTGSAAFVSLLGLRFFLGAGEAATYPVAARAIASWVPSSERTFSNSLMFAGSTAGAALTPPLIAYVMERLGWRTAFYISSLFPLLLAVIWWLESRDAPQDHGGVNDRELAIILAGRPPGYEDTARSAWRALTGNRNVALLALSYFFDSYVVFIFLFWLFKYLVDVRKFSVGGSGWATALPYLTASIVVPLLGRFTDRLSGRVGMLPGRRIVAMTCLMCSGTLLFIGAKAANAWLAVATISLSVSFLQSTEGPYWSTAIDAAGPHAGGTGGLLNTAGNLGGVVSTSLMPVLVHAFGWVGALASGSLFAFIASILWLLVGSEAPKQEIVPQAMMQDIA
jgi:ACS family glucarate transporter-like MFS transporter